MYPPRFLRQSPRFLVRTVKPNCKIPSCIASLLVALCLGNLCVLADPLLEWTRQDPVYLQGLPVDLTYGDGKYVAVGRLGRLHISDDQGITWRESTVIRSEDRIYHEIRYLNGKFFAVGQQNEDALISSSIDAVNWTHTTIPEIGYVAGIAYGNGIYTTSRTPLVSTDGENWTQVKRTHAYNPVFNIEFGNGQFVGSFLITLGLNYHEIVVSTDGVNWETVAGAHQGLRSLVVSDDRIVAGTGVHMIVDTPEYGWIGSKYPDYYRHQPAALAFDPVTKTYYAVERGIRTSENGVNWSDITYLESLLSHIAFGENSIVCMGYRGSMWNKQGNEDWIQTKGAISPSNLNDIAFGRLRVEDTVETRYVATPSISYQLKEESILISGNGVDWERISPSADYAGSSAVAYGKNRFVAVGTVGSYANHTLVIHTSSDGVNFEEHRLDAEGSFLDVAYGANTFVAVGDNKQIYTSHYIEGDSGEWSEWTHRELNPEVPLKSLTGVVYGDGYFIAVGNNMPILRSPDGLNWTSVTSTTTYDLQSIAFGRSTFVAVGNDTVVSIDDGSSWETVDRFEQTWRKRIEFAKGEFIVLDGSDRLYASKDGFQWTIKIHYSSSFFRGITLGDGFYYAVGRPGTSIFISGPVVEFSFHLGDVRHYTNGDTRIHLYAEPGSDVRVQTSSDLQVWRDFGTVTIEQYPTSILDTEAIEDQARFYRAVMEVEQTDQNAEEASGSGN